MAFDCYIVIKPQRGKPFQALLVRGYHLASECGSMTREQQMPTWMRDESKAWQAQVEQLISDKLTTNDSQLWQGAVSLHAGRAAGRMDTSVGNLRSLGFCRFRKERFQSRGVELFLGPVVIPPQSPGLWNCGIQTTVRATSFASRLERLVQLPRQTFHRRRILSNAAGRVFSRS
jgi:hypothetical protein